MTTRSRVAAGAVALVAAGQYFAAEALAASAWTSPGYSYSRNYISDLGRSACAGTHPCSPWAAVMNTGFVLGGVLAITAALLLAPLIRQGALRRLARALAVMHGLGSIVVGFAHGGAPHAAGWPSPHVLGAYAAIVAGNCALITLGVALHSRAARLPTLALGLFGLGCGLALVTARTGAPGLLERGAVDAVTIWQVAAGLMLLVALRRPNRSEPLTT